MARIAFLVNSTIKKYAGILSGINTAFRGTEFVILSSSHPGHITSLARKALEEGVTHLIVVGGDGTLNEAINGVMQYAQDESGNNLPENFLKDKLSGIQVGLLPAGSGNDFSKSIHVTSDTNRLRKLIDNNSSKEIDVGWSSFTGKNKQPVQRFFINITDVGMGGEVARKLEDRIPYLSNTANYRLTIGTTFLSYKKSAVLATADHFRYENKVMNLVVANGKYFGSGLGIAPDAELNDGKFSVVALGDIGIFDYLRYLGTVKKCLKVEHEQVKYFQQSKLRISSPTGETLSIDMDGEFAGYAPMDIQCMPGFIRFIC